MLFYDISDYSVLLYSIHYNYVTVSITAYYVRLLHSATRAMAAAAGGGGGHVICLTTHTPITSTSTSTITITMTVTTSITITVTITAIISIITPMSVFRDLL